MYYFGSTTLLYITILSQEKKNTKNLFILDGLYLFDKRVFGRGFTSWTNLSIPNGTNSPNLVSYKLSLEQDEDREWIGVMIILKT